MSIFINITNKDVMKLKEIRDEHDVLSGVLIPADDIRELKESLKTGSKFFDYFDSLHADKEDERRNLEQQMPNGLTVAETNRRMGRLKPHNGLVFIHKKHFT